MSGSHSKFNSGQEFGYGICSSTATFQESSNVLHQQYYQLLPLGRIVCTITVESCTIDSGFFGVRLPNLSMEALNASQTLLWIGLNWKHQPCKFCAKGLIGKLDYFKLTHNPVESKFGVYSLLEFSLLIAVPHFGTNLFQQLLYKHSSSLHINSYLCRIVANEVE
jgi:hypothetical protein